MKIWHVYLEECLQLITQKTSLFSHVNQSLFHLLYTQAKIMIGFGMIENMVIEQTWLSLVMDS